MAVEWQDLLPEGLVDTFYKLAASETSTWSFFPLKALNKLHNRFLRNKQICHKFKLNKKLQISADNDMSVLLKLIYNEMLLTVEAGRRISSL